MMPIDAHRFLLRAALVFFCIGIISSPVLANRLWSSGFELNSLTAGDEWKTKTGSPVISTSIVRSGDYAMETDATSGKYVTHRWNSDNDAGPVFFRFYLRVERFPPNGTNSTIVALENTGGTDKIRLRLNDSNKLNLYNNEDSASIGNNSGKLDINQWYRVELAYYAKAAGSDFNTNVQAALDGNVFADGNAVLNNLPAQFGLGCTNDCNPSLKAFFDDVAINDSNGTSQNGFPGSGRIIHFRPNANGDSTQWNLGRPDNSNHFSDINEIIPDDGTSYIEDLNADLNHLDEFQLTNASIPSDSNVLVVAIGYRANVQNTNNNRYKLRLKSQSGGTILESDTIVPQDSANYRTNNGSSGNNTMNYLLTAYTKPASSNLWTAADLNNAQIGIQNTTATTNWIRATTMWLLVEYTEATGATPNQSPDINLLKIDSYLDNFSLPPFSYQRDENLTIDFNAQDADSNNLKLDLNYSVSKNQGTGQAIVQGLDLNQLGTSGSFRCDRTDFHSSTRCSIDWNIFSVPDGNYFLLIRVSDNNSSDFDSSDNNFMIDNAKPATAWDGNSNWQKTGANIHLACSDSSGSGCSVTKYRLDTDSSNIVSYGAWTAYSDAISIATDGNYAIDFNSTDAAGNIGDTNTHYALKDAVAPVTSWDGDNNTWRSNVSITLACTDANSGCSTTQYRTDTNAQNGVSYGSWTTYSGAIPFSSDGNYAIDFNSADIAENVETTQTYFVLVDTQLPATAWDGNNNTWQNHAATITLTCTSTFSPCSLTQYRLDSDAGSGISYGAWTNYSSPFTVSPDGNWAIDFNSSNLAGNMETTQTKTVLIETKKPSTSWNGDNNAWKNSTQEISLTCSDSNSGCATTHYRIDTDSTNTILFGSSATYSAPLSFSADGNWALDFNSSDNAGNTENTNQVFVLIDKNRPTVLITAPTEGETITSSTVAIQYQGNDSPSGIAKYWVSNDGISWIDNNQINAYSFTNQSNGIHSYWVRTTDSADNNSADANVTVTISVSSENNNTGGGGYPACSYYSGSDICTTNENCSGSWLNAYDSSRCCSTACQPTPETKEIILESPVEPFGATPLFVLDKTVSELASESLRLASARELAFSRKLTSQPIVRTDGSQAFKNTIALTVQNTSGDSLENVQVMENIPKSVILDASEITRETAFETVQADPVIRFSLGSISFGEQKTVSYSIIKTEAITPQQFGSFEAPIGIVKLLPSELCSNVQCRDENPCTEDVCVAGTCRYVKLKNGTVCGAQQQCQSGQCVSDSSLTGLAIAEKEQQKPVEQAQSLFNSVVLGTLIITLLAGFWLGRKRLKDQKGQKH